MASPQGRLPLGYRPQRQFSPVQAATRAAQSYAQSVGLRHSTAGLGSLQVNPHRGFAIQQAYRGAEGAPEHPGIRQSYAAMRDETNAQYEHMTKPVEAGGMGIRHEVTPHDPYRGVGSGAHGSAQAMAHDIRHGRIQTMSTEATGGHAFFSNEENDKFRAVHDVFGHAATGRGTTRHGEEAAFQSHVQMYSPAARPAMASETRGQNSFLNFSPGGGFPDQTKKLIGLPDWASRKGGMPAEPSPISAQQFEQPRMFD